MANLFKYLGILSGVFGALLIVAGIIGFYSDEFLNVRNFNWFFWAANSFIMLGIFGLVGYIALREKK